MQLRCPHCDQPALAGDVTCWHCGRSLPGQDPEAAPPAGDEAPEDISLKALAAYLALTAAIIIALLLVLLALGRQPVAPPGAWWPAAI
ncbi:MAG: hypothetical protein ACRDHL_02370 [Candidatus Promineifilaceae bacterium]